MKDINIVLLENVKGLGEAGKVVTVSEGYARNFLFPQALAAQATESRVKEAEKRKEKAETEESMALQEAERQVGLIDGKTIPMTLKSGPEGRLFGSVTSKDITEEIEKSLGAKLPKGAVKLKSPLKQIGEHPVHVEFPHGLEADLIIIIEAAGK